jgi:hypothetical protein
MRRRFTRQGYPVRDTFERSQQLRGRHSRFGKTADPAAFTTEVRKRMREAEAAAQANGLPRPCWCFRAEEVEAIDFDENGQVLFVLPGRVIDDAGEPRVRLP